MLKEENQQDVVDRKVDDMKRDRDDGPERRPFQDLSRIPIAKPECKVQKEKSEKSYDDFTLFCHKTSLYDGVTSAFLIFQILWGLLQIVFDIPLR